MTAQFFWPSLGFRFEPFPQILECYSVRLQSVFSAAPRSPLLFSFPAACCPFTFTPSLASVVLTFITSAAQSCPVVGLRKSTAAGVPGWAFIFLTENFFLV
ncbi:tumor necrosis factor, alpha-induced protein 1 (endothelial), isoform CRA_a [Rattus norvegicus]|uniref:Tumor necrosis factor, alpha-induced protein 1 (Endothelial), isoform CRA_a n=1 Tax=Rattus norvegicus TaxID=10116 RepID=A6HH58_RAT|nr:tumor necrosis factor, alpha-induced protein 1 (endothelial), isoform CRA_a [Rattus norvegicus]